MDTDDIAVLVIIDGQGNAAGRGGVYRDVESCISVFNYAELDEVVNVADSTLGKRVTFPSVRHMAYPVPKKALCDACLTAQTVLGENGAGEERVGDDSILRLNAECRWETAEEPLHYDIERTGRMGIGMGIPLAFTLQRSLLASPIRDAVAAQASASECPSCREQRDVSRRMLCRVGLVPCAIGGASIVRWTEKDDALTPPHLASHPAPQLAKRTKHYSRMLHRARAAMQSQILRSDAVHVYVWFQGESDALEVNKRNPDGHRTAFYKERLLQHLSNVREDMGPRVAIVLVQTVGARRDSGRSGTFFHLEAIRQAQREVAELDNNVVFIPTELAAEKEDWYAAGDVLRNTSGPVKLKLGVDGKHLTALSQIQLGEAIAVRLVQRYPLYFRTLVPTPLVRGL